MRLLKWISWALAGLFVLMLLGLAVLVWVVDPNAFKPRIEAAVREATGRDFTLVGDIQLGFFPWLALRTGTGQIGNPPGFPAEPMASWKQAQLGARLLPLIRGELEVDRIRLEGADIRLTRRADGSANWEGIGSREPVDPNARSRHITIDGLDLRDSRLLYVDEVAARRVELTAFNLSTDAIAAERPITDTEIHGVLHMDGFTPAGVPFHLEVPKVALSKDYSSLDMPRFSVQFGAAEAQGSLDGDFDQALRLNGAIETNAFDARALLAAVGIAAPKTSDPRALTSVKLSSTWRFDNTGIRIDPLKLWLDDTRLSGHFSRGSGEDPVGEFELKGDRLDIARYIPPTDPTSPPFVLPTATLRALKFRGMLELEQASYEDTVMKGVTLRLLLDDQGMRTTPVPVAGSS